MIALAAVRATREALVRGEGGGLPSIVGVAAPGETAATAGTSTARTEIAVFPGDLPADCSAVRRRAREQACRADFRFVRFRPPALEQTADGIPALPHIRLDRALQFLIGDRLR